MQCAIWLKTPALEYVMSERKEGETINSAASRLFNDYVREKIEEKANQMIALKNGFTVRDMK